MLYQVHSYSQDKMDQIIVGGIAFCGLVYGTVGMGGYWGFGDEVTGNLLASYPTNSFLVTMARVAMSFLVAISYPLMCKPGRDSFLSLLRNSATDKEAGAELAESTRAYSGFTLAFLGASYAIAMGVVNYPTALNVILSLLGATTSTVSQRRERGGGGYCAGNELVLHYTCTLINARPFVAPFTPSHSPCLRLSRMWCRRSCT